MGPLRVFQHGAAYACQIGFMIVQKLLSVGIFCYAAGNHDWNPDSLPYDCGVIPEPARGLDERMEIPVFWSAGQVQEGSAPFLYQTGGADPFLQGASRRVIILHRKTDRDRVIPADGIPDLSLIHIL